VIAIPALLKGLVYHEAGLVGAEELLFPIKSESFVDLRQAAAKQAMKGEVGSVDLGDVGRRLMEIALMALGSEEESWLLPYFEQFTKEKRTPADGVLERFALSRGPADWVEQEWNATGFLEGRLPRNPIPVVSGPTPGVQAPN
jgi:gamma-glutamylcysteine synthetase